MRTEPDDGMARDAGGTGHAPGAYVGTVIGESTSQEFRLAIAHEAIREQDLIAVDAELRQPFPKDGTETEQLRIWAKVQRIERLNPLFPSEAGHELAATRTDPFDTVLSLSREMVTAVCHVLGAEPRGAQAGKLGQLRYPARPATRAYRPESRDVARLVLGDLGETQQRGLDIAALSNRPEIDVLVDGHDIVTRHLAILAMTGAGKSWAARRIIEELARRNWPMVIFDPHGDYSGLMNVPELRGRVTNYFAQVPVFDEDAETVAGIIDSLSSPMSAVMRSRFGDLFEAAVKFLPKDRRETQERIAWLTELLGSEATRFGVRNDLWLVVLLTQAASVVLRDDDFIRRRQLVEWGWTGLGSYGKTELRTLDALLWRIRGAASALQRMERINRQIAASNEPLPLDRAKLVSHGRISVISLAGYTAEFQSTIYALIANSLLDARVQSRLPWPVLMILEEAHSFVPGEAHSPAESRAVAITRQVAQEGRKFGVGLLLISQRPSRLDSTTLSQCNSFVIMRMVNPADQQFVRLTVESLGEDDARLLPDLDVGEALLAGQMISFPVLVRMKPPQSRGEREEEDAFVQLGRILAQQRQ